MQSPDEIAELDTLAVECIRSLAREAGFSRIGFAPADRRAGSAALEEWLARGFHGEMSYLERTHAKRSDPRLVLEGARTVCVLAVDYRATGAFGVASPLADRAEIATYARGTDYHDVLDARLRTLCERLSARHPGAGFRYYADTGPVLEKAWAAEAGIGWIGKNTCSIDRENGSYYFLSVILTTLAIPATRPANDLCGTCRICIDACPTGALIEPYILDARRCISYLTIELRGEIAPELEPALANLVFGCDICQDVCPWNRTVLGSPDPALRCREENVFPELVGLLALDEEGFRRRFPRSPVRRTKWRGFLRNVIIAAGNSGSSAVLEGLRRLESRADVAAEPILVESLRRALQRLEASLGREESESPR
jgi:epoxyqueuosine reductase